MIVEATRAGDALRQWMRQASMRLAPFKRSERWGDASHCSSHASESAKGVVSVQRFALGFWNEQCQQHCGQHEGID